MFKIMPVLSQHDIIWNIKTEEPIPLIDPLYTQLSPFIDLKRWIDKHYQYYLQWLYEDSEYIHDIYSSINQDMIKALVAYNKVNVKKLLYWFDVDRSIDENFKWALCPLSQTELTYQGTAVHPNNRFISLSFPLVFPEIGNL